jgi:threonine/homoserine/homoserine lactone efflux protein
MIALSVSPKLLAFVLASLVLALVPGPAVIYLMTQTLSRGRHAGLASVGGIAIGNLMNAAAASFGLAAILATSASAFALIKLAGAGYLIFLGIKTLRSKGEPMSAVASIPAHSRELFRDAVLVAFLNPKTALFFAALLPQFVDASAGSLLTQNLLLAGTFVAIALCTDTLYVLTASGLRAAIARRSAWTRWGRRLSAATFIALGVYAAVASPRAAR